MRNKKFLIIFILISGIFSFSFSQDRLSYEFSLTYDEDLVNGRAIPSLVFRNDFAISKIVGIYSYLIMPSAVNLIDHHVGLGFSFKLKFLNLGDREIGYLYLSPEVDLWKYHDISTFYERTLTKFYFNLWGGVDLHYNGFPVFMKLELGPSYSWGIVHTWLGDNEEVHFSPGAFTQFPPFIDYGIYVGVRI